ncbi:hypothetical protein B0J18DRAFT_214767 [Chaetomium sp. MPI-SDFR-AT-0129]|nr:hypothetical protein B0J18DRAFT_214767 [Chaetomium sp. MPI-SDFR-AT-0129]
MSVLKSPLLSAAILFLRGARFSAICGIGRHWAADPRERWDSAFPTNQPAARHQRSLNSALRCVIVIVCGTTGVSCHPEEATSQLRTVGKGAASEPTNPSGEVPRDLKPLFFLRKEMPQMLPFDMGTGGSRLSWDSAGSTGV